MLFTSYVELANSAWLFPVIKPWHWKAHCQNKNSCEFPVFSTAIFLPKSEFFFIEIAWTTKTSLQKFFQTHITLFSPRFITVCFVRTTFLIWTALFCSSLQASVPNVTLLINFLYTLASSFIFCTYFNWISRLKKYF